MTGVWLSDASNRITHSLSSTGRAAHFVLGQPDKLYKYMTDTYCSSFSCVQVIARPRVVSDSCPMPPSRRVSGRLRRTTHQLAREQLSHQKVIRHEKELELVRRCLHSECETPVDNNRIPTSHVFIWTAAPAIRLLRTPQPSIDLQCVSPTKRLRR